MAEFLAQLGITPVFLKSTFELSCLSLFFVCLAHSFWTHGWKRTVREFTAGFFLTAFCESVGVLSGAYVYPGFHFYIFATPIANPASWIALVYIIIELTNRLVYGPRAMATYETDGNRFRPAEFALFKGSFVKTILVLAVIDSSLALVIDLVMDPLATIFNWWIWVPVQPNVTTILPGEVVPYNFSGQAFLTTPQFTVFGLNLSEFFGKFFPHGMRYPTRVFGIPFINFLAWFVFVFVFALQFRYVESKEQWGDLKKTLVLWSLMLVDVPVMSFLLITPNI